MTQEGSLEQQLLDAFEIHSVEEIRRLLATGLDLQQPIRGKLPVQWLIEMYLRSRRFPACLRLLLDHGAELADPAIAPVLLNDPQALRSALETGHLSLDHRSTLVCAFTPLDEATLLHIAAEFGAFEAVDLLIEKGVEIDACCPVDGHGLNGHTPLFHTVNSHNNFLEPIMEKLLHAGADPGKRLAGLTWGRGFEWETTLFDVTPISYAQAGLLPQMHRDERQIYSNVKRLLQAAGRPLPPLDNVPNRYLV